MDAWMRGCVDAWGGIGLGFGLGFGIGIGTGIGIGIPHSVFKHSSP